MSSLAFQRTFTIALGTTNNNLLAGDLLQFLPNDMDLKFWATQSAVGLDVTITVGTTVMGGSGQPLRPNIDAAGNVDVLRDGFGEAVGAKSEQVIVTVVNPTAGALNITLKVQATPIPSLEALGA